MTPCKHAANISLSSDTKTDEHVDLSCGGDDGSGERTQEEELNLLLFFFFLLIFVRNSFALFMGSDISKPRKRERPPAQRRLSHGFLSNLGVSISHRRRHTVAFSQPVGLENRPPIPTLLLPPEDTETTLPPFISIFLPEFPQRTLPGQDHFQILGFIAKGSYGPILKVKDIFKEKTYAVKVLPKSEILKHEVLEQSKEEVIIQRQLKHPFIHNLRDCWQTQRHLFIMCDYCSTGDLYTYWLLKGRFGEDEVRIFAAELGSALGFLHDLGIMHRDVKMENILLSDQGHLRLSDFGLSRRLKRGGKAFTICGTIQYMAPEVLSGGPYNHAADWWSLGIMLFSLATGEFPVPAEPNHSTMLNKLLCKNPMNRLHILESFKMQAFFHGISFDSLILEKTPVEAILELRTHPDRAATAMRGLSLDDFDSFDCDRILHSPTTPTELSPTLANMDLSPATQQTCKA
ncbi:ribosomal protein S6 kinase-related protein isoform X2 [Epinephelus fuscoguttatus]|uniref:ribosomal protein S6 kinase-related protein isoform X2 n=1 Tax=Epinephelus fuscoguttatus TaxID=293821 RepID=UPI0020D18B5F|nr:ribosomal protein S6 kinase-related protein isoform X2 [Epinephelus fuscoguttatus]